MSGKSLAVFQNTADKICIGDIGQRYTDRTPPGYVENWFINSDGSTNWKQISWWTSIHLGGGNYGYLDGHVKFHTEKTRFWAQSSPPEAASRAIRPVTGCPKSKARLGWTPGALAPRPCPSCRYPHL